MAENNQPGNKLARRGLEALKEVEASDVDLVEPDGTGPGGAATLESTLNVIIYPESSTGGAGPWVAHCLELDLVARGPSAARAIDAIAEAIERCAEENVRAGRPPLTYRSAPLGVWRLAEGAERAAIRPLRIPQSPVPDEARIKPLIRRAR